MLVFLVWVGFSTPIWQFETCIIWVENPLHIGVNLRIRLSYTIFMW